MPFSNHTFRNSNIPLLQRFQANSSHPEHWCLTGKVTEEVKVRLLLQFPADRHCCLLLFYDLPQTGDNLEYTHQWHNLTVIPSGMEIINSWPISAPLSLSLKKGPLPETDTLSDNSAFLPSLMLFKPIREKRWKNATTTTQRTMYWRPSRITLSLR